MTSHLFQTGATTNESPILGTPAVLAGNKENFKLYRIPGFDSVLVKAVPRVKMNLTNEDTITTPPSEVEQEKEPTIAIIESYLGTKTMNDTVNALQGVRDMLKSGVLTAQREAAEERPKEIVFVVPPMMPRGRFQPIVTKPKKVPVTPFLSHITPISMVQNFALPDLKPLSALSVLPVPQRFNTFQHMISMPVAPLPIRSSLPSFPNYLVPRPMNPVDVIDIPFQPFVNPAPIFVKPSDVAVKGHLYPYKPCCKSTVEIPAKSTYLIEEKVPAMRSPLFVKNTVEVPRPPSIIIDRLANITGKKIFAQRPVVTMFPIPDPLRESMNDNVRPLSVTWTYPEASIDNDDGYYQTDDGRIFYSRLVKDPSHLISKEHKEKQYDSYKVVNKDGSVTTFSKLSDNVEDYDINMESDDGYYETDDGRIFYSRLVKDPSLSMSKDFQDELTKKHRKNQYTVTNVEEFKNLLNQDDVQVTYGEDTLPSLKFGGINENSDESQAMDRGIELPSGPSKYNFKQIHKDGSITEYIAYDSTNPNVEVLQNVHDFKYTEENSQGKGQTPIPGGVMIKDPTYVFKHNNHNNSQYAVGQVEDTTPRFDDKIEDQDKVSSDGTQNWDTEVHSVPPSEVPPMALPVGLSLMSPNDFTHAPPEADVQFLSSQIIENQKIMDNHPFEMIDSVDTLKPTEPSKSSSNANEPFFSNTNPIVVVDEKEGEDVSSSRGDIPEAFA